jgi:hypothetical protein
MTSIRYDRLLFAAVLLVEDANLPRSRPLATAALAVAIIALILLLPQRAGGHPGEKTAPA